MRRATGLEEVWDPGIAQKAAIRYLAQPAAKFALKRLKTAYKTWNDSKDDGVLLDAVTGLAQDFAKDTADGDMPDNGFRREELELICFEYVSS